MSEDNVTRLQLVAMLIVDSAIVQHCVPKQHSVDAATTSSGLSRPIAEAVRRSEQVAGNKHM